LEVLKNPFTKRNRIAIWFSLGRAGLCKGEKSSPVLTKLPVSVWGRFANKFSASIDWKVNTNGWLDDEHVLDYERRVLKASGYYAQAWEVLLPLPSSWCMVTTSPRARKVGCSSAFDYNFGAQLSASDSRDRDIRC
jgi:hypothetical protein